MAELTMVQKIASVVKKLSYDEAIEVLCTTTGSNLWLFRSFLENYKKNERKEFQVRRRKDHRIYCDVLGPGMAEVLLEYFARIREGEDVYVWRIVKLKLRQTNGRWSVINRIASWEIYEVGK